MSYSSGANKSGVINPGTAGSEGIPNLGVGMSPGYYGLKAWNAPLPLGAAVTGASGTTTCWAFKVMCPNAFTLSKVAYFVSTAQTATAVAQNATTVAAGSNGVDVATFAGAGSLTVAATGTTPGNFSTTGTAEILVVTSTGFALITYTSVDATHFLGCTTRQGTGTVATGGAVTQSYNTVGVFDATGTACLGLAGDQITNWATTGYCGAAAAPITLNTFTGTSAAVSAGAYLWVVYLSTTSGASPIMRGMSNNSIVANADRTGSSLVLGRVSAAVTYFPIVNTTIAFVPGSLTSTNTASPGHPWFGLA